MGRIFETRKHVMFARWNRMAKQFTRIGKDITIAVRASGPDPDHNPALRRVIQNARAVNMPKDKVEAAIKRASSKDVTHYEEAIYEGYAPHGVAVIVQTATDNPTRTVGNVRNVFNRNGGNMASAFRMQGVWDSKQAGYRRAMTRHAAAHWDQVLVEVGRVDRIAKGRADGDAWQVLERALLAVAEPGAMRLLAS